MIKSEKINFLAKRNAPNPWECTYWIDLTTDKDGKVWKVWNGTAWVVTSTGGGSAPVDAYTKAESDQKYATKTEVQSVADDIDDKQDTLVSGTNIKTINSLSILGAGNIEIMTEGGGISDAPSDGNLYGRQDGAWTEVTVPDTSNLATKAELANKLDTTTYTADKATFALKTEIPDISALATKEEVQAKQDTLVSGTNIKTVNGQSILGSGNLEFTTGTGGISDAPSDGKLYGRKDANWEEIVASGSEDLVMNITSAVWDTDNYKSSITRTDFNSIVGSVKDGVAAFIVAKDADTYTYFIPVSIYEQDSNKHVIIVSNDGDSYTELNIYGLVEDPLDGDGTIEVTTTTLSSNFVTSSTLDNYLTKAEATNDYATKSSIADMETLTHAAATYQAKGNYATAATTLSGYGITDAYTITLTDSAIDTKIAALVDSAPETLNTLNELSAALGDDPNFATTVSNQIGLKLDTSTYNSEKTSFATTTQLNTKVTGTGVTAMSVVAELPGEPDANTLYIITAA